MGFYVSDWILSTQYLLGKGLQINHTINLVLYSGAKYEEWEVLY